MTNNKYNHTGLYPQKEYNIEINGFRLYQYRTQLKAMDGIYYKYDYVLNNEELICTCLQSEQEEMEEALSNHTLTKSELIWSCLTSKEHM